MNIGFEIVGWFATILAIIMFAPQTYKVMKQKSASYLSSSAFSFFSIGVMFWAIYTPLVDSLQGFITNAIVLLLLIPIFFYIFRTQKWKFIIFIIFAFSSITFGIIALIYKLKISVILKYVFVLLASSGTTFWTIPQIVVIVKRREVKDYSIITGLIITLTNLLWVIYWIGMIPNPDNNLGCIIISIIASFGALLTQLPILIVYIISLKKSSK